MKIPEILVIETVHQPGSLVLGFPGLFKGALAARAKRFTDPMLVAAAECIARLAPGNDLVPDPLDRSVHAAVAAAVEAAA